MSEGNASEPGRPRLARSRHGDPGPRQEVPMGRRCRGTGEESDGLIVPMKRSNKPVVNGGGGRGGKGPGRGEGQRQRISRTQCRNGMTLVSLTCGPELHGRHSPERRSRSTFGRSPLRESRTAGSVRGAVSNHRPYRDNWAGFGGKPAEAEGRAGECDGVKYYV